MAVAMLSPIEPDPTLPDPIDSVERPCPTLSRMLHLAGARLSDRIWVAGPASYPALLALCRMGFQTALRVCETTAPHGDGFGAEGPCDVALSTGPLSAGVAGSRAFEARIGRLLAGLRNGGVLVVHETGLKDDALVRALIERSGAVVGWCVHDMAGGCLAAFQVLRPVPVAEALRSAPPP